MQKIRFNRIAMKNFRKHSESDLQFPDNTFTAIVGPNGSGKSSHFMALITALYGSTAENINISDMVNKKKDKDMELFLDFNIDSQKFEIHRYYKHTKHANKLVLMCDGKDISRKTTTETYKYIEQLLVPKHVFLNSIYFSQQVKDFFTCLTDKQQKEIFNNILQTDEFKCYYDATSEVLKTKETDLQQLTVDIDKLNSSINDMNFNLQTLQTLQQNEIQKCLRDIESYKSKICEIEVEIKNLLTDIQSVCYDDGKHQEIKKQITNKMQQVNKLQLQKNSLIDQYNQEIKDLNSATELRLQEHKRNILQQLKGEVDRVTQLEKDLKTQFLIWKNDNEKLFKTNEINECSVFEKRLSVINAQKTDIQYSLIKSKSELDKKISDYKSEISNIISDLNVKISDYKNKVSGNELTIKQKTLELNALLAKIKQYESSPVNTCPVCKQQVCSENHDFITQHINELKTQCEDNQAVIKQCEKEIKIMRDVLLMLEDDKTNGMRIKELNEKILVLNNTYLAQMTTDQEQLKSLEDEIKNIKRELESICNKYKVKFAECCSAESLRIDGIIIQQKSAYEKYSSDKTKEYNDYKDTVSNDHNLKKDQIKTKYDDQQKQLDVSIEQHTLELNKLNDIDYKFTTDKNKVDHLNVEISKKQTMITSHTDLIEQLKNKKPDNTQIDLVKQKISDFQANLEKLVKNKNNATNKVKIFKFWKDAFSDRGIPSMLIDSSIPFLNTCVKEELEKIGADNFVVTFDTLSETKSGDIRDKFSVNILNVHTGTNDHKLLSGGEKRQIDVCCMRALRKLTENMYQKEFNIWLLDEVLDSLDAENAQNFCRYVKMLSGDQSIVLITHSIANLSECDSVIKL